MNLKEKTETYLRTHKKPVTARMIAHHYLINIKQTREALKELKLEGKARSTGKNAKREKLWAAPRTVAVSHSHHPAPAERSPAAIRPIQNSYPTIRGYDD